MIRLTEDDQYELMTALREYMEADVRLSHHLTLLRGRKYSPRGGAMAAQFRKNKKAAAFRLLVMMQMAEGRSAGR